MSAWGFVDPIRFFSHATTPGLAWTSSKDLDVILSHRNRSADLVDAYNVVAIKRHAAAGSKIRNRNTQTVKLTSLQL